jgi:hypothetical protein
MRAHNRGGWVLVHPQYFHWGKEVMKVIRASITKEAMNRDRDLAQKKAAGLVFDNKKLKNEFKEVLQRDSDCPVTSLEDDSDVVDCFYTEVVKFAFHARSGEVWRQVNEDWTDRTVAKENKVTRREALKVGSKT